MRNIRDTTSRDHRQCPHITGDITVVNSEQEVTIFVSMQIRRVELCSDVKVMYNSELSMFSHHFKVSSCCPPEVEAEIVSSETKQQ